jgi:hypothetical protein
VDGLRVSDPKQRVYQDGLRGSYTGAFALQGDSDPADDYKNGNVYGDIGVAGKGKIEDVARSMGPLLSHRRHFHQVGESTITGAVHSDANSDSILNQGYSQALAISAWVQLPSS